MGEQKFVHGLGHMTKRLSPIHGKNPSKIFFSFSNLSSKGSEPVIAVSCGVTHSEELPVKFVQIVMLT